MDGILPLWKEAGMTSHDCVFKLRKILHTKKIGHGGTLDPDVSGVLPICIGKGTKVIEYMVDSGKTYEGEITLGFSTTTEDVSGEVVEQVLLSTPFSNAEIDAAMQTMTGSITQIPPMFSAVKVNGKRLYEYARNGEEVERPKRTAMIYSFERTSEPEFDEVKGTQSWRFKVVCGKGTYVRTLSVDTGLALGVPAHMSQLTRTASGGLTAEQSLTLDQVAEKMEQDALSNIILPIEIAIERFQRIDLSDELYQKVKNGVRLSPSEFGLNEMPQDLVALFYQDQVVSLYMAHPTKDNVLKPSKVLRNN
ncbi:tRNA pseudouridine(55) synthase [Enterococcus moraviensis ATCC BAA-383]|uniref:tRNA pseudouridine synthase B n=1 Tax=Enterococcus moraviensis ATCC BAA-383 TaxID=1158609 RepID=R2R2I8_9ENTE|nr:tRNA pseudouridine(55) synthase TruB [Enterococcus moraviensis]EOI01866.1 tRNA pseudouridine(55) synthase [Enterococcus moraviensis ATCC BAA-383]EOT73599.1 tRNA pseudouridine synthase B [Enterococcus moraviensis ATCC BAA-383]OJG69160.1 tRNA pseudouridine(55) synthase [Enterococcus moraviensis]